MPQRNRAVRITRRGALMLLLAPAVGMTPGAGAGAEWWRLGQDMLRSLVTRPSPFAGLSTAELAEAVHEALVVASVTATETLSRRNGFYGNPDARIPLPAVLATTRRALQRMGMAARLATLEERINRGAEMAVADARDPLVKAVFDLDLEDAGAILQDSPDGATRYLEARMRPRLVKALRPAVGNGLVEAGAIASHRELEAHMRNIPFLANIHLDLLEHVLECTLQGLFQAIAEEEARLRANPGGRGSDVFQRVFSRL
ncbi:MAG: DUF4197 domain-containing protein [Thioalkalivibrio sp.]|nr:DUF4197 domain-containing protein [Thioalkalivibrio sp.]